MTEQEIDDLAYYLCAAITSREHPYEADVTVAARALRKVRDATAREYSAREIELSNARADRDRVSAELSTARTQLEAAANLIDAVKRAHDVNPEAFAAYYPGIVAALSQPRTGGDGDG